MKILAKCSTDIRQIEDRLKKGATGLELHTFMEDIATKDKALETYKRIRPYKEYIKVLHLPIHLKCNIEGLNALSDHTIERGLVIIQSLSDDDDEQKHIIFHQDLHMRHLHNFNLYEPIKAQLQKLLEEYPNVTYNLENLMLLNNYQGNLEVKSSYFDANVELCKALKRDLNTDRIGIVTDTCHMISTNRIYNHIFGKDLYNINDYIRKYGEYINIVHLANATGYGINEGHGTTFNTSEEDIQILNEILHTLSEINYQGIMTLEVYEENFYDAQNYLKTLQTINNYINQPVSV